MTKHRVLLVHAVIVSLIVGSLYAVIKDKEYWPFSHYPVFSRVEQDYSVSSKQLYGVTQEEPHREIPLRSPDYVQPFDQGRLMQSLTRMNSRGKLEKRQQLLNVALLDCLRRYEKLRLAGLHEGPPLQGMRLYEEQWQIDARAENVDEPNQRELVAEVEQPQGD